jgi:signal transduction histidine kinase
LAKATAHAPAAKAAGDQRSNLAQLEPTLQSLFIGTHDDLVPFLTDVPAVVYECNESLAVTRITANTNQLLGLDPQGLLGRRSIWGEQLHPADGDSLVAMVDGLASGQIASSTHRLLDQRGLPVWVSHSFKRVASAKGDLLRGCIVPIPKENSTQVLDPTIVPQFVHKLGNHFQLINLLVGNMRRSGIAANDIDVLQQALDEAVDFTRTFLNYALAPDSSSEFDLSEILKAVIQVMLPSFTEKQVSLNNLVDVYFSGALVVGDPFLLEAAFTAILQNALDACNAKGQVSVSGKVERRQAGCGLSARVVFADSGCGMEREDLARAVEPFVSSRRDRSGLGLAMASRITEQHGGVLQITSVVGKGTQVEIALPVVNGCQTPDR